MRATLLSLIATALLSVGLVAMTPVPRADAAARVSVANASGAAAIDPTYATSLTVRGSGFQSVRSGHGGLYVFFGTVRSGWRPSQGGATGQDYLYVPDSEAKNNNGYQRYVAFPGSDTATSANGGTMTAGGEWSVTIRVPGATFKAIDRGGRTRTVDCRKLTCGIITVGAHGVANAHNETFTPVQVRDLSGGSAPADETSTEEGSAEAIPDGTDPGTDEPRKLGPMALDVDRGSAQAGNVLSFSARGLQPRAQVSAILDDGVSANGPFVVGDDGRVTGVISLPVSLEGGTHELRLYGLGDKVEPPAVRFAVRARAERDEPVELAPVDAATSPNARSDDVAPWFFGGAMLILLLAVIRVVVGRRPGVGRGASNG